MHKRTLANALCAMGLMAALLSGSAARAEPQKVTVGVYLKNVESIDISSNTYYLDFMLWMRWKGSIDPTASFRFTNLLDKWGVTINKIWDTPRVLSDGSKYQRFTVEGKFYHKFWLGTFPLDWQKVTLELVDQQHSAATLVYVPDVKNSKVDPDLAIPGWRIGKVYNKTTLLDYGSSLGQGGGARKVSRYRYGLKLFRPVSFFLLKVIPPCAIVLLCSFLIFFVRPTYVDARIGTVITALLTEVFLQLTFTGNMPNIGIMMLLDQIFNFSYLVMFLMLLECIIVTRMVDQVEDLEGELEGEEDEAVRERKEAAMEQIEAGMVKWDTRSKYIFPTVYILGCVAITLGMRGLGYFTS